MTIWYGGDSWIKGVRVGVNFGHCTRLCFGAVDSKTCVLHFGQCTNKATECKSFPQTTWNVLYSIIMKFTSIVRLFTCRSSFFVKVCLCFHSNDITIMKYEVVQCLDRYIHEFGNHGVRDSINLSLWSSKDFTLLCSTHGIYLAPYHVQ